MPQSTGRRVIGHAIGGKVCERARKSGTSRCTSGRRRRNAVRHAISPTMLATIIVLFVDITGGDHPSSSSEDTVETLRRPVKTRVLDNVGGPSVEIRHGEENVQHEQVETAQISDNVDNELLSDVKQSVSSSLFASDVFMSQLTFRGWMNSMAYCTNRRNRCRRKA